MTQTLIEKLQALVKEYEDGYDTGSSQLYAIVDLRAIIEEYKATEQDTVAWRYKYTEEGDWTVVTSLADSETEKWVRENYPNFVIEPLFTHPQLSDETVKDAARWNRLIKSALPELKFKIEWQGLMCDFGPDKEKVSVNYGSWEVISSSLDDAMKAEHVPE